jgi:hypothetical protein
MLENPTGSLVQIFPGGELNQLALGQARTSRGRGAEITGRLEPSGFWFGRPMKVKGLGGTFRGGCTGWGSVAQGLRTSLVSPISRPDVVTQRFLAVFAQPG